MAVSISCYPGANNLHMLTSQTARATGFWVINAEEVICSGGLKARTPLGKKYPHELPSLILFY